ncbi:GH36-type glycosyl hydrolase domain-containing protein [Haploplasma axanthum]|uniref:Cellobiose phosphorylase n=3 Tax=Haploplasma axanthum TaxID=29552 RepID=A0A449BF74_HAPAX|nr:glycosyl transferase [Haploplasma axanthum]VEU81103.1 Cellobiose phosphorylase [Haploplasma axanthum]
MKYGQFDDKRKEYVIKEPLTPVPWINYLGNNGYYGLISNTGGGYTFYQDAKLRRLTRYRYNNVPTDFGGRYYYINDGEVTWNPGYLPLKMKLDRYETRHGLGYTIITGEKNGIEVSVTYFIPLNDKVEIHVVKVKNKTNKEKTIKLFGLVEWALWNAEDDQTNFQRNLNIGEVEVEENTVYHKTEYRERRNHFAYYNVNKEIKGFDTSREAFLGSNYNTWRDAEVIETLKSKNSLASGGSPIASLEVELKIAGNSEEEIIYQLGYYENKEDEKFEKTNLINKKGVRKEIKKYHDKKEVKKAFEELNKFWDKTLSNYKIESNNEKFDRMINIWNQYQCMTTFNMSRSASYYESGTGRGMGFRDSCQDILGFVHMIPERSRERIIDLASIQMKDGSTYHQYQPLTKKGNANIGSGFNDDPLWLVAAVSAYIKETNDYTILEEMVPYNNEVGSEEPLFNHLYASIHYTINNKGPHGLPLIGRADWNDCLNLNCFSKNPGESFQTTGNIDSDAESVFIAGMFVKYATEYVEICERTGKHEEASLVKKEIDLMSKAVINHGWDGEWYLRAYDAFGNKVGSNESEEGKIFIEPQGFCTMAEIGGIEYGKKALASVDKYLKNEYGAELLYPAYTKYHLELGEITSYPPGNKENGSVFCHNNPWVVIGYTTIRDGEKAFDLYKRNAPAFIEDKSEIHRTEPYVYSQTIAGRAAKNYGEAKNSWLTGTASWTFVAASAHIVGVRAHYDGLEIDPVLPSEIDNVRVYRRFRDKDFDITIIKDSKRKGTMVINGEELKINIVPLKGSIDTYKVIKYI